jgi:hypothetical protein
MPQFDRNPHRNNSPWLPKFLGSLGFSGLSMQNPIPVNSLSTEKSEKSSCLFHPASAESRRGSASILRGSDTPYEMFEIMQPTFALRNSRWPQDRREIFVGTFSFQTDELMT